MPYLSSQLLHKLYEPCLNCIFLCAHHFMKDMEVSVACCNLRTTGVLPHRTCCKKWDSQPKTHLGLNPWQEFSRAWLIPIHLDIFPCVPLPNSHVWILPNALSVAMWTHCSQSPLIEPYLGSAWEVTPNGLIQSVWKKGTHATREEQPGCNRT